MKKIDTNIIQKIKTSYERGVPLIDIAKNFNISRQLVSKFARKHAWMKSTSKKFSSHIKVESDLRRQFEQDDRDDQKAIESHFSEWQIVRKILQYAIDHKDADKVILAQKYAETLALIQSSELHLRSYRTRGRLKPSRLHLPNSVNNTIQQIKKYPHSLTPSNEIQRISIGELFNSIKVIQPIWHPQQSHIGKRRLMI